MKKTASQLIFDRNKSTVLKAIRDHGPISRIELTQITNISAPTMTRLANSLLEDKLVRQTGMGDSSGGRRPNILEFNSRSNYVIGIEWGLTHMKGVLSDLDGSILFERDYPCETEKNIEKELEKVKDLIRYLIGSAYITADMLKGIGIAAAGYINKKTDIIEFSPVQEWHGINIKEPLEKEFKVPVYVDYISRVMALSEHLYGQARGVDDFIFITVDYGMGAGIISNGELIKGADGYSGEFGHIRINPGETLGDRDCVCGKQNCLAEYVSGRGISASAGGTRAREVALAAEKGDETSRAILREAGEILGVSIANISNILNPEMIVMGGTMMKSGFYYDCIRESFEQNGLLGVTRKIELKRSAMLEASVVTGAVALVLQSILMLD